MQTGTRNALPAYSLLFVPGNRPERFAKAVASGASAVILDLEDAVHPRDKAMARAAIRTFFASGGVAMVRINQLSTEWASQDLMLIQEIVVQQAAGIGRLTGVILPKTESTADVECVARYLPVDIPVFPLIETALGLLNAREIASAPSVLRLLFGTVDFCLDLNIEGYGEELNSYRAWLVLISRGAGLEPPVDGVTISLKDESALLTSTLAAKRIGFGGKLCIHPNQVACINTSFRPTALELKWALDVTEMANRLGNHFGAFEFAGKMVDAPVLARAQRLLDVNSQSSIGH